MFEGWLEYALKVTTRGSDGFSCLFVYFLMDLFVDLVDFHAGHQ